MADIASIFASTLNARDQKEAQDQVFNAYPLFVMMGAPEGVDGGAQIQKTVRKSKNTTVAARDYRESVPLNEMDSLDTALFPWKYLNGSVVWWDAQERMNTSKSQIVDLIKELVDNLDESMREGLALEMWEDGSGKHFDGILAIIDNDNVYGGIDRSLAENAYWRAMCGDRSAEGTGMKFDTAEPLVVRGGADGGIEHLYHKCAGNGGSDPPQFGAMPLDLYEKIKGSYDPKYIANSQNKQMADVGFTANFMIGGTTFFYDENCPSGSLVMVNTKHTKRKPHTANASKPTVTPPQPRYANGQFGKVVLVQQMENIVCRRPNRCGALTNKS